MRNSKIKLTITAMFLAGTIGTFSVFAHEGEGKGMMSSEGMEGMGGMMGMMNMMSDMSPEDRKAMTDACMKMMQSHGNDNIDGANKNEGAETS
ncbi:hypothetical protein EHN06_00955 [Marinobacter sp. NP-4(2019)]|uniref:hypothetical protein n=1 Tax=Marinobacter sp. NP-4(2019) TaxID=2488665 RepID=UPI000FC3D554|nr:hypothetical protein [Marinobacter sp. NP-4(2019)]AZT82228.1 hypothetical protein EHN06_00955 [Marinobacter sp. NP-4(2019)]